MKTFKKDFPVFVIRDVLEMAKSGLNPIDIWNYIPYGFSH